MTSVNIVDAVNTFRFEDEAKRNVVTESLAKTNDWDLAIDMAAMKTIESRFKDNVPRMEVNDWLVGYLYRLIQTTYVECCHGTYQHMTTYLRQHLGPVEMRALLALTEYVDMSTIETERILSDDFWTGYVYEKILERVPYDLFDHYDHGWVLREGASDVEDRFAMMIPDDRLKPVTSEYGHWHPII